MNEKLNEKIKESLSSVLPITVIVLLLSISLVPLEIGTLALFLTGAFLLVVGMGFFQLGAEMAMTPLGQGVGARPNQPFDGNYHHHRRTGSPGTGQSGGIHPQPGFDLDRGSRGRHLSRRRCSAYIISCQPVKNAVHPVYPAVYSVIFLA